MFAIETPYVTYSGSNLTESPFFLGKPAPPTEMRKSEFMRMDKHIIGKPKENMPKKKLQGWSLYLI